MGKRRVTPGTGQLNLEIELALLETLRAFVKARGEKIRHVVEMALRRHLENPPPPPKPVEVPPLPPVTVGTAPAVVQKPVEVEPPKHEPEKFARAGEKTTVKKKGKKG